MIKFPSLGFVLTATLLFTATSGFTQVTLSTFDNFAAQAPDFSGSWDPSVSPADDQYIQNLGFISITSVAGGNPREEGEFTVQPPLSLNTSGLNQIALTARVDSGNAAQNLNVLLFDSAFQTVFATFSLAGFSAAFSTVTTAYSINPSFNPASVVAWQVTGGDPLDPTPEEVRVSLENLAVVPEPSSAALFGFGMAAMGLRRRRRLAAV